MAPLFFAGALMVGCAGCSRPVPIAPPAPTASVASTTSSEALDRWITSLDRDHPLVGRVWDTRQQIFVDPASAWRSLGEARFVLLGERHDNPDHHRLQAATLTALVTRGLRPVVAWEMIETPQQAEIDRYRANTAARAEGLGNAVVWEKSNWPPWTEYLPIAQVAFDHHLRIVAANLPQTAARSLVHEGPHALGPDLAARLGLDRAFPADLDVSLQNELRDSHCGHLPEAMIGPMALAQHARDAQMARVLLDEGAAGGAVLIAGAGHTRRDRGVPFYLSRENPAARMASVAFVEVEKGRDEPRAYAERFGVSALPFDFVWFTPRKSDDDPCARFKK